MVNSFRPRTLRAKVMVGEDAKFCQRMVRIECYGVCDGIWKSAKGSVLIRNLNAECYCLVNISAGANQTCAS